MKLIALLLASLLSTSSFAASKILCSELQPDWMPVFEGSMLAEKVGHVVLFDINLLEMTQLPASMVNSFEARVDEFGKTVIHGLYTSGEKYAERVSGLDYTIATSAAVPSQSDLNLSLLYADDRSGHRGEVRITLTTDMKDPTFESGKGEWNDDSGARGTLAFCTSFVGSI